MAGIDASTGRILSGWAHVLQSLQKIFTTPIGARVMRRTFGSEIPAILGRSMTPPTILRFKAAVIACAELWEPRFRISIMHDPVVTQADISNLRRGRIRFLIDGTYRPRGHLGDETEEASISSLSISDKGEVNPA